MPIDDWSRYAAAHLAAMWADGPVIWHNGSNSFSYALQILAPAHDLALFCASNTFDAGAVEPVCIALLEELAVEHIATTPAPPDPAVTR